MKFCLMPYKHFDFIQVLTCAGVFYKFLLAHNQGQIVLLVVQFVLAHNINAKPIKKTNTSSAM